MSPYAAESKRLYLQTIDVDIHLEDYHLLMTNPESMAWSTKPIYTSISQTRNLILESKPTAEKPWNERWGIMLQESENENGDGNGSTDVEKEKGNGSGKDRGLRMIGLIGTPREGEIGYRLHSDFFRRGYMSEAIALFIDLFWRTESNARYTRLLAFADPENIASIKTLERAGFQKGEYRKEFYERGCQVGVKSDLQGFFLERPNLREKEGKSDEVVVASEVS